MTEEQAHERARQTLIEWEQTHEEAIKVKGQFIACRTSEGNRPHLTLPERTWDEDAMKEIERAEAKEREKWQAHQLALRQWRNMLTS